VNLSGIPQEFLQYVSDDGTHVALMNMALASVPDWLGNLTALTHLNLSGNELASLPDWLGNLTTLTDLNLSGNELASLPDSLGNLTALTELTLNDNQLASLPDSLGNLTALTDLNLGDNQLTALPDWLGNLTALTRLDLWGSQLTALPDWLGNLTALTHLTLGGNQLASVPDSLENLTALTELNLGDNQLASLPDWLGNLTALTGLYLWGNQLTALPDWLGNLTALTRLALGGNQLTSLPDWLGNLTALADLNVWGNQLTALPDWLGNLTTLTELTLSGNQLTAVPDSLENLTALTELNLGDNQLASLPDSLGNLTALTRLDLSGNRLTFLPIQLANLLVSGIQLELGGNPLDDPLPELAARGPVDLATYLRSLKDAIPQYEAKLLLVGEGNVGKTSLVTALKGGPFVEGRPTTHGIEISPLTFRHPALGLDMTLRAWDFGGQEVYRISHQFFFSRRALYVVVWNARQGQEQDEVEDWLRRIHLRVGRDAPTILVATHCTERLPELDYSHLERLFPGMLTGGAFEIDSRTGLGIPELQAAIGEQTCRLPQMGQLISPRWVAAREDILARADTEPQIRYEQFAEICEQHGLTDPETSTLAKLMHDLGLVIYYAEDEGLRDIVVLNPEWLTKAISYVLNDNPTRQAGGILDHARLREIWHDRQDGYDLRYHRYFLRLMEKFDISYRLDGDELHSLVAQLVPHQRPALPWQPGTQAPVGIRTLTLVCRLSESAPGLIPWLTVRHHRASIGANWRRGVFLRHPITAYASEALLELHRDNELALEVRAPSPDMYFNVLRDSIEDLITSRWPGLDYRLLIPCPGKTASGSPCPGQFPLDGLLRQRQGGQITVACMDCPQVHEISALLTGFAMPSQPLAAELEQMHGQLAEIKTSITGIQSHAAEIAETVRRVQRVVSMEVTDCPRLFTLAPSRSALGRRARVHQHHYRLTLWCEHPGYWHPWEPASYDLDPPKEWFTRIAPYAILIVRTLQLIVPLAGAVAVASLPQGQQGNAQAHLQVMSTLVADLPSKAEREVAEDGLEEATGQLTAAEGQALRAIRTIVFEHDQLRAFGGLRRVQASSGDLLWVCADHYPHYDPGLPIIP
jgi:internalin A